MRMFSLLSKEFLFFQTVSLFLQLEQPLAVTNSHFPRMFSPFDRLFFSFPDDKFLLQSLVAVALVDGISGCHGPSVPTCTSKVPAVLLKDAPCFQALFPGWQALSLLVFQQTSSSV